MMKKGVAWHPIYKEVKEMTPRKRIEPVLLAPMPFSDGEGAPAEFVLIKFGRTEYTKGRSDGSFQFDDKDADRVIADFAKRKKDLVIDYDHATVSGGEAPAAGWIEKLEKRDGGLVAKVNWTAKAAERLGSREYRYHSPVIFFDPKTGRPASLHSVALTNHPAFHGYDPLVADDIPNKETHMNEHLKRLAELLGIAVTFADGEPDEEALAKAIADRIQSDGAKTAAADAFLKAHNAQTFDDMEGQLKGMVPASEKAELEKKLAAIEAEKAVAKAFDDGKLVEPQREWALAYAAKDPQAFADFIKNAPKIVPVPASQTNIGGKPPKSGDAGEPTAFSDADKAILKRMGINPEDIKKEN